MYFVHLLTPRVLLAVGVGALVLGAAWWIQRQVAPQQVVQSPSSQHDTQDPREAALRDRDGDGLRDWEERLWRTNADQADTDGDGTPDGQEVAEGRDPTRPGPHDLLASPAAPTTRTPRNAKATSTLTHTVIRSILQRYLELRARGGDPRLLVLARSELTRLLPEQDPLTRALQPTEQSDLEVVNLATPQVLRAYGNAVARALSQPTPTSTPPELLYRYSRTRQASYLAELDRYLTAIDDAISLLIDMPVPQLFATYHVALVNVLREHRLLLGIVRDLEHDPILAAYAIRTYVHDAPLLPKVLSLYATAFATAGITFAPTEAGALFEQAQRAYAAMQQETQ